MPPRKIPQGVVKKEKSRSKNDFEEKINSLKVGENEDPGICIEWSNDETLHACLALPGAPIPQGADPAASGRAIKDWVSNSVTTIASNARQGDSVFDHLTLGEYAQISNVLHNHGISLVWGGALANAQITAGKMYMIALQGSGKNAAFLQCFSPFI